MEQKVKKEQLDKEKVSLGDYHFVTVEDFEKALKNDENFRKIYNKCFEEHEKNKISK